MRWPPAALLSLAAAVCCVLAAGCAAPLGCVLPLSAAPPSRPALPPGLLSAAGRAAARPACCVLAGSDRPPWAEAEAAAGAAGVLEPLEPPERRHRRSCSCCAAICFEGEVSGRRMGLSTSGVNHAP